MPEYGKRVQFPALVVEASDSFGGTSMIRAADVRGNQELARLTPADDAQNQKMGEMRSGAKFTASCEVGFAMELGVSHDEGLRGPAREAASAAKATYQFEAGREDGRKRRPATTRPETN